MTTIAERVPVDEITRQARDVHFWRSVLALATGLIFGAGWVVARLFAVAWLVMVWVAVAFREGWRQGRNRPTGPSQPR